jgi:hypothetical protein
METLTVGYLKWAGGKPVDGRMGLVADGFRAPPRSELDDFDSKNWETDKDGARKDPWQKTTLLVLVAPTAPHDLFTFTTGTVGGQGAIRDLCEAHARTTEAVEQYPVVLLGSDSYQHKDRTKGRVYVPVFRVVDSVEAAPFNAMVAEARGGAGFIPTSPPALMTPGMIAIARGRSASLEPPTPPEPLLNSELEPPPIGLYEGPEDGAGDFAEDMPF